MFVNLFSVLNTPHFGVSAKYQEAKWQDIKLVSYKVERFKVC